LGSSTRAIEVAAQFFTKAFIELTEMGFNLKRLGSVEAILADQSLNAMKKKIADLTAQEVDLEGGLPSVRTLKDLSKLFDTIKTLESSPVERAKL